MVKLCNARLANEFVEVLLVDFDLLSMRKEIGVECLQQPTLSLQTHGWQLSLNQHILVLGKANISDGVA